MRKVIEVQAGAEDWVPTQNELNDLVQRAKHVEPVLVEYRIKAITRYEVTRFVKWEKPKDADEYTRGPQDFRSVGRGEYSNADLAYEVGYALCKTEHEALGWSPGDERMVYPRHPSEQDSNRDTKEYHSKAEDANWNGLEAPTIPSDQIRYPIEGVLDSCKDFVTVVVVGIDSHGEVQVASSVGTPQTLNLLKQGPIRIAELVETS